MSDWSETREGYIDDVYISNESGKNYSVNLTESVFLSEFTSPLNRIPYIMHLMDTASDIYLKSQAATLSLQDIEALTYIKKTSTTLEAKFKQRYRW